MENFAIPGTQQRQGRGTGLCGGLPLWYCGSRGFVEWLKEGPTEALIVVDLQNDFCAGGALAVPDGDAVVAAAGVVLGSRRGYRVRSPSRMAWRRSAMAAASSGRSAA